MAGVADTACAIGRGRRAAVRRVSPHPLLETRPQAAQLFTPELPLKALLEENGKVLLRLMNARATKSDKCSRHDLLYLASLRAIGTMPTFSGDTFKNVSLVFIDLAERAVAAALGMRQQVILTLLINVAHTFETMFVKQVMVGEVSAAEIGCW
ncbi:hypothetical protein PF007_g12419 [Phytophthora fragariae]|uniref:Uncharacterized protein n=1 Tax=Phytophthora fragariae TaxID=53985 RepID=A0A6A3ESB7_9STRA|nr:hypothetical protein PF009_g13781 [Phytophthora fragariae]KAE9004751.1 hypothetical protein PF011_g12328 [Phytophthora fragariae]KAE9109014.1 hypothetical protein PF007_g12419 [Phytophthora fragariae]